MYIGLLGVIAVMLRVANSRCVASSVIFVLNYNFRSWSRPNEGLTFCCCDFSLGLSLAYMIVRWAVSPPPAPRSPRCRKHNSRYKPNFQKSLRHLTRRPTYSKFYRASNIQNLEAFFDYPSSFDRRRFELHQVIGIVKQTCQTSIDLCLS